MQGKRIQNEYSGNIQYSLEDSIFKGFHIREGCYSKLFMSEPRNNKSVLECTIPHNSIQYSMFSEIADE